MLNACTQWYQNLWVLQNYKISETLFFNVWKQHENNIYFESLKWINHENKKTSNSNETERNWI